MQIRQRALVLSSTGIVLLSRELQERSMDSTPPPSSTAAAIAIIAVSGIIGLLFAAWQYKKIMSVKITVEDASASLVVHDDQNGGEMSTEKRLVDISGKIQDGAKSFLREEYMWCLVFLGVFGMLVLVLLGTANNCKPPRVAMAQIPLPDGTTKTMYQIIGGEASCWPDAGFTFLAFIIGGITSMACGYLGMMVAVFTNVRTTVQCTKGWKEGFNTAFRGGAVMGFALTSIGLLVLLILVVAYNGFFGKPEHQAQDLKANEFGLRFLLLMEAVAGFGLGGSSIALFGRVGGGIYTKAADVGADLVGKVVKGIPEDDPRNPATIADNVGDNVGDIAGMGADLFGSFAEATCAALVIGATSKELNDSYVTMFYPLVISAIGILGSIVTTFFATDFFPVTSGDKVEWALKLQLIISTFIIACIVFVISWAFLPSYFTFVTELEGVSSQIKWWAAAICVDIGLFAGLGTGLITEYYTSHSYRPVREVAESTADGGAATLVIFGLALGYMSAVLPVIFLAITVFVCFYLANLYGVALGALGMLSSLAIGLTIDGYGPITDNAGGIAEMAELGEDVRDKTDTLDAAGNTTAAIGKGFAIGSAALVSLSLWGAYMTRVSAAIGEENVKVNVLSPIIFAFLLIGAMIPYAFAALTMKSVGVAAKEMVAQVKAQFDANPGIMEGTVEPDYDACIKISTKASLREMVAPAIVVMATPILTGYLFGIFALAGLLAGSLVSSVQLALSASNTGGAWDNAKKYIEKGSLGEGKGKGSEYHKAAVIGDTVGDPLKDTSGPALNIVMKLMAIISLIFANSFASLAAPIVSCKQPSGCIPEGCGTWAGYVNTCN